MRSLLPKLHILKLGRTQESCRTLSSMTATPLRRGASSQVAAAVDNMEPHAGVIRVQGMDYQTDSTTNVSPSILSKTGLNLHNHPASPLCILKNKITAHFKAQFPGYESIDSLHPVVSTVENFDDLLIAKDHPGRSPSDTYYINSQTVLRTHTSAHQSALLSSQKAMGYLVSADVYRRDEIDSSHYPVFHQMEGIRLFEKSNLKQYTKELEALGSKNKKCISVQDVATLSDTNQYQSVHSEPEQELVTQHLKRSLEGLMADLFASERNLKMRWIEGYFPFTQPSWELEVFYQGKWLEVCGCGVIHQQILKDTGNVFPLYL